MKRAIFEDSEDGVLSMLKDVSQHQNKENAFFKINCGGWKYGIWGLCPSEVLHQFYEGVISYCLDEFVETLNEPSRIHFSDGVHKIINAAKNLGCKNLYPMGAFAQGITKFTKMKGVDKFGCLFYLTLFLNTDLAKTQNFAGIKKRNKVDQEQMDKWLKLFEMCLYYHDWVLQTSFKRKTLHHKKERIHELHDLLKDLIQRKHLGIRNVPKFHEFYHIIRNIQWHGPAISYDTRPAESNLKVHKNMGQNTQRHVNSFCRQTASRLFEHTVITQTYGFVRKFASKLYSNVAGSKNANTFSNHASPLNVSVKVIRRDRFFMKLDPVDDNIHFYSNENTTTPILNTDDFDNILKQFIKEHVVSLIEDSYKTTVIKCYGTVLREGIPFRGLSPTKTNYYPGWAIFQWVTNRSGVTTLCPAKILMYMDLSNITRKPEFVNQYCIPGLYVIIQSLERTPAPTYRDGNISICGQGTFESCRFRYHIVSESCIHDSCFVIPNIGSKSSSVLYVYPRNYNLPRNHTNNRYGGWASNF